MFKLNLRHNKHPSTDGFNQNAQTTQRKDWSLMSKLPKNKIPKMNHLRLEDLSDEEQEIYDYFTDYLSQNYNCDHDIRQSLIGQLLINTEDNDQAELTGSTY